MQCGRGKLRVDSGKRQPPLLRQRLEPAPALRHRIVEGEEPAREADAEVVIQPGL